MAKLNAPSQAAPGFKTGAVAVAVTRSGRVLWLTMPSNYSTKSQAFHQANFLVQQLDQMFHQLPP